MGDLRFKLDENLGQNIQQHFHARGHDCHSVHDESLAGASDDKIYRAACEEGRILVTADHDFTNILRYPPQGCAGIVVINPPGPMSFRMRERLRTAFLDAVETGGPNRRLWIVEPGRIRERLSKLRRSDAHRP